MNRKKLIGNLVFLGLVFIGMVYSVFREQDIEEMIAQLNRADIFYWIIAVVFVVGFITWESIILFY